jgi:uncharacterized UBP type Zn finger protein
VPWLDTCNRPGETTGASPERGAQCLTIGSLWVHLRMCLECGRVGCCDDSPYRHASKHTREVSHPIIKRLIVLVTIRGVTDIGALAALEHEV